MAIIYANNYFFSRVFLFKVSKTVLHITNLRKMNNLELINYLIVDLILHFPCGAAFILEKKCWKLQIFVLSYFQFLRQFF